MGRKTPQPERGSKRGRTSTDESDLGEGTSSPVTTLDQQQAEGQGRSPLSKRRKIASARVGQSKLKHSFDPSAIESDGDDDDDGNDNGGGNGVSSRRGTITSGKRMDSDADDDDDGDDEDDGGNAKKKRRRQQQQQQQDDDEDEDEEDEDEGGGGQRRHSLFLKRAAGRNSGGGTTKHVSLDNNGTGASQEEGDDVEDVDDQEGSVGSLIDESFLDGLADEIALDLEEGD
ncbi:hypothetical protein CF326_g2500 [Tilletia indica]|nr:hypothetical protein CF326_g2500 [Tilletia indica]